MTLREAQEFIKREGFAWTAVYVDLDEHSLTIGAKWRDTEYLMIFNTDGTRLLNITEFR